MCGRFVGFRSVDQLKAYFPIDRAEVEATANYNVAPTQEILALVRQEEANVLDKFHLGLVPHWAGDTAVGYKMINARMETVASKPSFREAFKKRRCLIPAGGFYEWKGPKGRKQPVFITLPDERPFGFAGLWETWHAGKQPAGPYRSCTIITRPAGAVLKDIHDRMPAIVNPDDYVTWLNTANQDTDGLLEMLAERTITDLVSRPVSRQVNATRINTPENIKPVQLELDF